ncbi:MAG: MmoB/DmpM family protein [Acidimicrobiia bacterium]
MQEHLGRDWGVDDLQVIMASYFGFISRWEPDGVVLEWLRA